jgi:hypothetical protein
MELVCCDVFQNLKMRGDGATASQVGSYLLQPALLQGC